MLPSIDESTKSIVKQIQRMPSDGTVSIVGGIGLGKTSTLFSIARSLEGSALHPVLITPPQQEVDTACSALVQIASALKNRGLMNGEYDQIRDPALPWVSKLDSVKKCMTNARNDIVLLVDEPTRWQMKHADASFANYSNQHTIELIDWLLKSANCRRVCTHASSWDIQDPIKLTAPDKWNLWDESNWPTFSPSLYQRLTRTGAAPISFLHAKYLAVYSLVSSTGNLERVIHDGTNTKVLATELVKALMVSSKFSNLWKVVRALSLVRVPMTREEIDSLPSYALDPLEQILLHDYLLTAVGDERYLHPILRFAIQNNTDSWKSIKPNDKELNGRIQDLFKSRISQSKLSDRPTLSDELESWHHSAVQGDVSQIDRAFFVDQLHVLGRTLSKDFKRHPDAVRVFERVIELDNFDDYGHHYLAYNLDCMAIEEDRIEAGYQKAISLFQEHPWWWSRWINFLITTGQAKKAKKAWNEATNVLGTADGSAEPWIYEALHVWVARLLLRRAQLDFMERVLADVPAEVRATNTRFVALDRHLTALKIARDEYAVFPINIDPKDYWEWPHTCLPYSIKEGERVSWFPARIESVDSECVSMVVGKRDSDSKEVTYGAVDLTLSDFNRSTLGELGDFLSEGRFVELGFYGDQETMKIGIHPDKSYDDPDLPPLDPPNSRRYLTNIGGHLASE